MKTSLAAVLLFSIATTIGAQTVGTTTNTAPQTGGPPPQPTNSPYAIKSRDANSRVWERTTFKRTPSGQWIPHLHRVTELATGMNHYDSATGQWLESKEEIDIMPDGSAQAVNGQHSVHFPANIYSGVIDLVTSDGEELKSRPLGISYYDGTNSVLIAELTNSVGELISSNQVIYTNAFTDFAADIVVTYRRSGLEADLIIRSQPPLPESFGLSSQHCRMELLTEFFSAPGPEQTPAASVDNLSDATLQFGTMKMIRGKAFEIGSPQAAVPVAKTWGQMNGRTFLIEAVRVPQIIAKLQSLPVSASASSGSIVSADPVLHRVSGSRLLPALRIAQSTTNSVRIAKAELSSKPGILWDYNIVNSQSDMTFSGDATYYVSGSVNLSGTTVIEGGTVIKYDTNYNCAINILGTVSCQTAPYRPAVFTSADDVSVGEPVSVGPGSCPGTLNFQVQDDLSEDLTVYVYDDSSNYEINGVVVSAGNTGSFTFLSGVGQHFVFDAFDTDNNEYYADFYPTLQNGEFDIGIDSLHNVNYSEYGDVLCTPVPSSTALLLANGGNLHDLLIRYVGTGIESSSNYCVTNLQFVQCRTAAFQTENASLYAGNVLISHAGVGFSGQNFTVQSEQLTYDQGSNVAYSVSGSSTVALTNALITGVTSYGNPTFHTNNIVKLASGSGVYQSAGAGSYYLGTNSPSFIGTNISPALLAQLRQKTVYPPNVYSNITIATNMEFGPQAPRDTNALPSLGYHYDPLDWCFGTVTASSNLTFDAGTAVGWFETASGAGYGIALSNDSTNTFNGTLFAPCVFAHYSTVQEGGNGNWISEGGPGGLSTVANSSYFAEIDVKFTRCYALAEDPNHFGDNSAQLNVHANHSEFYSGNLAGHWLGHFMTNCLFDRVSQYGSDQRSAGLFWRNCTMHGGNAYVIHSMDLYWPVWIENCAFDGSTTQMDDNSSGNTNITYCNFNAFLNGAQRLVVQGRNDVVVTNTFTWQTGSLGAFYQATNSPLIDVGSVTADQVGLYNFTTQTNQTEEMTSIVDIGYHYVALDQYGNILDSDDDGLGDWWELDYFGTLAYSGTNLDCFGNTLLYDYENEPAALAVPVITTQPASSTNKIGDTVTFTVLATNNPPVLYKSYQWVCDGTNIPGAIGTNLVISNVQANNAGSYWAVVSSTGGMVESVVVQLTVVGVSRIIEDGILPEVSGSASIATNTTINLRVIPTANPRITNFPLGAPIWTNVSGPGLTLPSAATNWASFSPTNAGQYTLSASCGTSSNIFTLTVVDGSDSDYDGIPDSMELGYAPWQTELGSWRFDTADWIGLQGQLPLTFSNLQMVTGWSIAAVEVNSNAGPAMLEYGDVNTNTAIANIDYAQGSIRFWFKPDWISGSSGGPQQPLSRLIEAGTPGQAGGSWGLYVNSNGTSLSFQTQGSSTNTLTNNLTVAIDWATNWHHLTLTYSITNSTLYLDGQQITNGLGVTNWPSPSVRSNGFRIGTDANGTNWAQGRFDNLETFNYVMPPAYVTNYFLTHSNQPGVPPGARTNFCELAPIALYFPLVQTLTNGQPVTTTQSSSSGNFLWLSWADTTLNAGDLAAELENFDSVTNYVNPDTQSHDVLFVGDKVLGDTGNPNTPDIKAALDSYTNAPGSTNPVLIGVVLTSTLPGSGGTYTVAAFATIELMSYSINSGDRYFSFIYKGARPCDAYFPNLPPTNQIVSPANNQVFTTWNTNATIPITSAASDPEDGLRNVAFYSGPNLLTTLPYYQSTTNENTNLFAYIWNAAPHGGVGISTVATDELYSVSSASVSNIVNWPPQVNFATNLIVTNWPEGATNNLLGIVTDDGLPSGIITNIAWTVLSSNGPVTFTNQYTTNTQVSFTTNGTYVLQLSASDGVVTGTNTCTIIVRPRPFISITAPMDGAIFTQGTPITLNATAYDPDGIVTNVQFFNGATFIGNAIQVSSTNYTFIWRNAPNAVESLIAVATDNDGVTNSASISFVVNQPPQINTGTNEIIITLPVTNATIPATVTDDGLPLGSSVTSTWSVLRSNGPVVFTNITTPTTEVFFSTNGIYVLKLSAGDTAATNSAIVTVIVNQRPQVNAGPNLITLLTGSSKWTYLAGTVIDDGLPPYAPVTEGWTVVSATNGTVSFDTPDSAGTWAILTNSGGYVLQLTANDTVSTNSSNVTVIVDRAPVPNPGTNQTLVWIEGQTNISTTLAGTISDDGYPYGFVTNLWTGTGPGTVTFSNATSTNTIATFSTNGFYTLVQIAGDGFATSTNSCTVAVLRGPFVNIDSPTNGASFLSGSPITNIITAYARLGAVTNVELFDNGTNLAVKASPSNRVDFWGAEGNARDAIGTNNGSAVGGTVTYTNGEFGQAFAFTPTNGYISIPDSGSLDSLSNTITMEMWIKANDTNTIPIFQGLVAKGNTSYRIQATGKEIIFTVTGTSGQVTGSRNVKDGQWHHVAGVYDGTKVYVYVDGTLDASQSATGSILQNTKPLSIGNNPDTIGNALFNGLIDEVSIYNRALSAQEIQSIYNAKQFVWTNAPAGTNILTAVATENHGLSSTSAPVTITVYSPLPVVGITSPTNTQLFLISPTAIWLTATSTPSIGTITNVEFFTNGAAVGNGAPVSNNIYSFAWSNVIAGTYSLTAKAWDSSGNVGTSPDVSITVNAMPAISITNPANLASFLEVTNVKIQGVTSDSDGSVASVKLYCFGTNILSTNFPANTSSAAFNLIWSNRVTGHYPVTAVATDNRGASNVSQIVLFNVTNSDIPPSVVITYPTNTATFSDGASITITAVVTNGSGTVTNVEFFVSGESIGSVTQTNSPYELTRCCWKPGSYILTARATDTLGASVLSTNVQITIVPEPPAAVGFWDAPFSLAFGFAPYNNSNYPGRSIDGFAISSNATIYAALGSVIEPMDATADGVNWIDVTGDNFMPGGDNGADSYWSTIATIGTNVYAAGELQFSNILDLNPVVEWNAGSNEWFEVGDGLDGQEVSVLANIGGQLYAGGDFTSAGLDTNVQYIARLDTVSNIWVPVGNGLTNASGPTEVTAIGELNGELYIGGLFTSAGGNSNASYIAKLVGNSWTNLDSGLQVPAVDTTIRPPVETIVGCGDNLYVCGTFTGAGQYTNVTGIAIWNETKGWQVMNGGVGYTHDYLYYQQYNPGYAAYPYDVKAISVHGEHVFVGGDFTQLYNGAPASAIAEASWSEAGQSWTWTDLDGGVMNISGGYNYPAVVNHTHIVEGSAPNSYDVYVTGGTSISAIGSAQSPAWGIARWRVGYPPPPLPAGTVLVTFISPQSQVSLTNSPVFLIGRAQCDTNNIIVTTDFYTNGVEVGTPGIYSPTVYNTNDVLFTNEWDNPSPGVYLVDAVASDDAGAVGRAGPIIVRIKSTNNPIVAVDDQYTIYQGTLYAELHVLTNDAPATGLRISSVTQLNQTYGTAKVSPDGTYIIYSPNPNAYGTDHFYYTVTNSTGASDSASVTVNIVPLPTVMITNPPDGYTGNASIPVSIDAVAFDAAGITNTAIYVNGILAGQNPTNTASATWQTNTPGFYAFTATAVDANGFSNTSPPYLMIVTNYSTGTNVVTAGINNLPTSTTGLGTIKYSIVTNGLFDLQGTASDSHTGDAISYQVLVHPFEDDTTILKNVTPPPLNAMGFHNLSASVTNGDLGTNDFSTLPNGVYDIELIVRGGGGQVSVTNSFQLQSDLKVGSSRVDLQACKLEYSIVSPK